MSTESSPERLAPNSRAAGSSSARVPTVSIVVLAGNDAERVGRLLEKVKETLEGCGAAGEILVVDAGDDKETAEQAPTQGITVLRQDRRDYVSALRAGLSASRGDLIVTLDGAHSHDPSIIRDLLSKSSQAEMVIASRYVHLGNADVSLLRRALSRLGNRVCSAVLDVPLR